MRTKRAYTDYLRDIKEAASNAQQFIDGISFEQFKLDKRTIYAVLKSLEIIGEASKHIPPTVRKRYPEIPWKVMSELRNDLVHEYFGVKLQRIWDTATITLPALTPLLARALEEVEKELFDKLEKGEI